MCMSPVCLPTFKLYQVSQLDLHFCCMQLLHAAVPVLYSLPALRHSQQACPAWPSCSVLLTESSPLFMCPPPPPPLCTCRREGLEQESRVWIAPEDLEARISNALDNPQRL
jgi:hypothetical protein